jgi:hypothetical protein
MKNFLNLEKPGIREMSHDEMRNYEGGKLTAKQEVWLERGVAFVLFGLAGVIVYELGRING